MSRISPDLAEGETLDSFYHGRIRLIQKRTGYRFSVDAPLLADFIRTRQEDVILELGTGNGVISLLLSVQPFRRILGLEVQPGLVDLARRNVRLNGLEDRITIREQDLRSFQPEEKFDVVFSNPPYIQGQGGQLNASEERSVAKHEIRCDIFDIMQAAGRTLKPDGRGYFIYPAARRKDFEGAVEAGGLKIREVRLVYSRRGTAARWLLAECAFSAERTESRPPLFVYGENGEYTPEMEKVFRGESGGANT
jgi:tRNA1(Val) A37 N6-methylase TrmN6